jgi:hypothetical protein
MQLTCLSFCARSNERVYINVPFSLFSALSFPPLIKVFFFPKFLGTEAGLSAERTRHRAEAQP